MSNLKKVLFIDRDGTLIHETENYLIDSLEKLNFLKGVIQYLAKIAKELEYDLVMITNQDGLGTPAHPEENFWPIHNLILKLLKSEGISFSNVFIDTTYPEDNAPTRKPNTGLLTSYFSDEYDLKNSLVIGDRLTDMELAKNLGAKGIWINDGSNLGEEELNIKQKELLKNTIVLETLQWQKIYEFLKLGNRIATYTRNTNETKINITLNLDGTGKSNITTGIAFFDHMLDQIARHGNIDVSIKVEGDLEVDEHHTIEDTMLALGETFLKALGNKKGIERYGFCLPMDDCLAQTSIDFGGRNWLVWKADFKREMIGKMPTEMFYHAFKSFTDGAKCNLNIKAEGENEHHKIEAIFKAFAKAIKAAIKRDVTKMILPTTKGLI